MLVFRKSKQKAISIHAPAKGATHFSRRIDVLFKISIHAPAKGATKYLSLNKPDKTISIHAPAKGATFPFANKTVNLQFQSTLPRRERLNAIVKFH